MSPEEAGDEVAKSAVQEIRSDLDPNVISHTDFTPLRSRPIAVSVETKRRGTGQPAEADLQMGIWYVAQWKLLSELVIKQKHSAGRAEGVQVDEKACLDGLSFLPGIVVNGHIWSFVATTREDRKTILWQERCFGDSSNAPGVYKIIAGIQRLARWSRDIYWPWYRESVLGIPPHIPGAIS